MAHIEGFGDAVKGAHVQGLDSSLDSLLATDHHYHRFRRALVTMRHQLETADTTHIYVAEHEVKICGSQNRQGFFSRGGLSAVVFLTQQIVQQNPDLWLIIDDQDSLFALFHTTMSISVRRQP